MNPVNAIANKLLSFSKESHSDVVCSRSRRLSGVCRGIVCLSILLSFALGGCSKSDSGDDVSGGDTDNGATTTQEVDYTALRTFLGSVATDDYCHMFSAVNGYSIVTNSGKRLTVDKGDVPYVAQSSTGSVTVDGKSVAKATTLSTNNAPTVAVASSGNLTINGVDFGVKAGSSLLCVVNVRKHIFFCFSDRTYGMGSEVYLPYNPSLPENPTTLNILFIGNSFTVDATEHLPGLLYSAGVKNVNMTRVYHGGYTLPEYYANFSTANICARYDYTAGSSSWSGNSTLDDTPADALASRTWDIIVIQEHTGRSEAWSWPGVLQAPVEGLRDMFYDAQPNHRPTVVYLMSQTYSNGSNVLTNYFSNSRDKMFETTTTVVKQLMANTGIDIVISSGATLENLRTTSLNVDNGMQLTRDSYHMDYGISRYAAACAVFETLITPTIGVKTSSCTYRYTTSNTTSGSYSTPVTDANAPIAQRAASAAVAAPFVVTDLSSL